MSNQDLLLVAILVFVLMNIGLFLTILEFRKHAGDTSVGKRGHRYWIG